MLKAVAQGRAGSILRLVIGLVGSLAVIDAIGAGALVAPALLPFLYWAVVTARTGWTRVLLGVVASLCFGVGVMVVLFVVAHLGDAGFWIGLALAVSAFVSLLRFAPRRKVS